MTLSTDFFQTLPVVDETAIDLLLQKEIAKNRRKFVVLDDDPTGVQTVHDISVFTSWDRDSILQGFQEPEPLFYILTNSRGLTQEETTLVHKQIAETVDSVAKELHKDYLFISRSDSTLRGHYPLEPELLRESYEHYTGKTIHGEILCPFFKEGGRFTIGNVHYVKYGNELVPANETEFAKDSTFGYTAATLPDYIEEKTKGTFAASDVVCISLDDLRSLNLDAIEKQLLSVDHFQKIIVNAVDYVDLKVFCIALYRAMEKGKLFLLRSAASIVKVLGGITDQPLLSRKKMITKDTSAGGVIVIGSHTDKTTQQLEELKKLPDIMFLELNAALVRNTEKFEKEVENAFLWKNNI